MPILTRRDPARPADPAHVARIRARAMAEEAARNTPLALALAERDRARREPEPIPGPAPAPRRPVGPAMGAEVARMCCTAAANAVAELSRVVLALGVAEDDPETRRELDTARRLTAEAERAMRRAANRLPKPPRD